MADEPIAGQISSRTDDSNDVSEALVAQVLDDS